MGIMPHYGWCGVAGSCCLQAAGLRVPSDLCDSSATQACAWYRLPASGLWKDPVGTSLLACYKAAVAAGLPVGVDPGPCAPSWGQGVSRSLLRTLWLARGCVPCCCHLPGAATMAGPCGRVSGPSSSSPCSPCQVPSSRLRGARPRQRQVCLPPKRVGLPAGCPQAEGGLPQWPLVLEVPKERGAHLPHSGLRRLGPRQRGLPHPPEVTALHWEPLGVPGG